MAWGCVGACGGGRLFLRPTWSAGVGVSGGAACGVRTVRRPGASRKSYRLSRRLGAQVMVMVMVMVVVVVVDVFLCRQRQSAFPSGECLTQFGRALLWW